MATQREIERKTTWSDDDEAELFAALKRARSDYARAVMLGRRSDAIAPGHPRAAIALREKMLGDYPTIPNHLAHHTIRELADLEVRLGDVDRAVQRYCDLAEACLAKDATKLGALRDYLTFAARYSCTDHYANIVTLLKQAEHIEPPGTPGKFGTASVSWTLFAGVAWIAEQTGDGALCATLLEKAKIWHVNDAWTAPDPWRLWLVRRARIGARRVAGVLIQPEFTLAEMRDWAGKNWKKFRPEIDYTDSENGERLILEWQDFSVDLSIPVDPKRTKFTLSFFTKKRLKKFDTKKARALEWKDAGDVDAVDAINTSIEVLDYFQTHPHVVVDIG